jgi:hypothetical protein
MRMVHDGMTVPGFLRGVDEKDTPLRFRYRTVSPLQRAEFQDMVKSVDKIEDRELLAGKMVAKFVKEWDQKYPEDWPEQKLAGKPVPITSEIVCNNIHPTIFSRLFNIVMGSGVSDPDPKDSADKQQEQILKNAMPANSLAALLSEEDQERLGNS